jgi:hypothetical protein
MNMLRLCNYEIMEMKASQDPPPRRGDVELEDGTVVNLHGDGRGEDEKGEVYLEISYGLGKPKRDDVGGWVWTGRQVAGFVRADEKRWPAINALAQAHFNPPPAM